MAGLVVGLMVGLVVVAAAEVAAAVAAVVAAAGGWGVGGVRRLPTVHDVDSSFSFFLMSLPVCTVPLYCSGVL